MNDKLQMTQRLKQLLLLGFFLISTSSQAFQNPAADGGNNFFFLPSIAGGIAHFQGSGNCAVCHDSTTYNGGNGSPLAYIDNNGKDVSIRRAWSATMMANSSRDPFWRAKVKSELNRHPELAAEINDDCTRCHAPMANVDAKSANATFSIFDDTLTGIPGILSVGNSRHDMASDGVSCTLCHQIKNDPTLGTLAGYTGGYVIDTTLSGANRLMYGPYTSPFAGPMRNLTNTALRTTPTYSAHIQDSKLCGTCHDLKTPAVDDFGNILTTTPESEFPEQMPYSEWLHSDFNLGAKPQSCQQCHMARTDGVYISTQPAANLTTALSKKNNFAIHEFVGGNKLMLDIFDNNKTQLGVLSNNFAATMAATDTVLKSAGSVQSIAANGSKNTLQFTLMVNSKTGHKLPSAYPSRRIILHVQVKNNQDQIVWESGKVNANGSVVGVNSDEASDDFEPHYDLITSADQVQVYESIMGDYRGQVTYTLLHGKEYLKDNRILPEGFNKTTAPNDVKVVGDALTDPNFIAGSDQVTYRIAGLSSGQYTIKAEIIYQTLAYGFSNHLFSDKETSEVVDFKSMFDASNQKSQLIADTQVATIVKKLGDIDGDGDVDMNDINLILAAKNQSATGIEDARDINGDMRIDLLDSRKATLLCTRARCTIQ